MEQANLEVIMGLIMNAGDAKSNAMEAIQLAKEGQFEEASAKIEAAEQALIQAHHSQTEMLTQEAQGTSVEISLLTVHSQDHLMTSITFVDLAKELVEIYQRIDK